MKLEFNIYELTEPYGTFEKEFIKVGEVFDKVNNEHIFLMLGVQENGLTLINGINIQENAYEIPSDKVKLKGSGMYTDCYIFDINKEYLAMDIIEEIQRLNGE